MEKPFMNKHVSKDCPGLSDKFGQIGRYCQPVDKKFTAFRGIKEKKKDLNDLDTYENA